MRREDVGKKKRGAEIKGEVKEGKKKGRRKGAKRDNLPNLRYLLHFRF